MTTKDTVDEIIRNAVDRFCRWKLPEDFSPDAGITFEKEYNVSYNANQGLPPCEHEPIGTNLFTAQQAEEMIRYILGDGLTKAIEEEKKRGFAEGYKEADAEGAHASGVLQERERLYKELLKNRIPEKLESMTDWVDWDDVCKIFNKTK